MSTPEPPLTTGQQDIVKNHINGAILLLAPVGTGKTRVLAERVVEAIANKIAPNRMLCLTFTNRAAKEMQDRLQKHLGRNTVTVKTFHGLCALILTQEAQNIGLPAEFVIYDEADSLEIIKDVAGIEKDKEAAKLLYEFTNYKAEAPASALTVDQDGDKTFAALPHWQKKIAVEYQAVLRDRHAVDFADLIYLVRATFHQFPAIKDRWANRFDFIQVDEIQDTHMSEYELVRILAQRTGNVAFIGDIDQTIYEWRGSEPTKIINQFKRDFNPKKLELTINHRSTQLLLKAADSFAASIQARQTKIIPSKKCAPGEKIQVFHGQFGADEGRWIGERIIALSRLQADFPYHRVAILTRTHNRGKTIAKALECVEIPYITVDQYQFFNRQEIKDAVALLRLMLNPYDAGALHRVLLRSGRGIGKKTVQKLVAQGQPNGLWLTDLTRGQTYHNGDPFGLLLDTCTAGTIVVFDVETTGLSVGEDEVIQLAATKLVNGKPVATFQQFIKNTQPVGESEEVHHLSDTFLAERGQPAKEVLRAFFKFAKGALLVGHNVGFDVRMVLAHARRVGLKPHNLTWADTYAIARRFVQTSNYKLETLVTELGINAQATHDAGQDVAATVQLLHHLIPLLKANTNQRRKLVNQYGGGFKPLAEQLEQWRQAAVQQRPADLLVQVLKESGLWNYYQQLGEQKRLENLTLLIDKFAQMDDPRLHPETALRMLVEFTALANNIDFIATTENRVMITTVHQAKGLEFDHVFIAGVVDDEFPGYFSCKDGNLEEERRLFYVALTRARQRLFISGYKKNDWGYSKPRSRFIDDIDPQCIAGQRRPAAVAEF